MSRCGSLMRKGNEFQSHCFANKSISTKGRSGPLAYLDNFSNKLSVIDS